ncbi:MAG: HD domain-containing protein [Nitrospirota bacterium]|nr:HD domain-containing protein [Nitrospirota bacterium]
MQLSAEIIDKIRQTLAPLLPATDVPLFLVGGSIRDLLMGVEWSKDIDLAVNGDPCAFGRKLAAHTKGSFFVMDEERSVCRVVSEVDGRRFQFDLSPVKEDDISKDMAERDFTINAMAVALNPLLAGSEEIELIDPFGGHADIESKTIRAVNRENLEADPLRLLRAIRLAAQHRFILHQELEKDITELAPLITKPAPERVRDELFLILATSKAAVSMDKAERLGLLGHILPETRAMKDFPKGGGDETPLWEHSLKTVAWVEYAINQLPDFFPEHFEEVGDYLKQEIEFNLTQGGLLKLTALLHDMGKPETRGEQGGRTTYHGHETVGAYMATDIAIRLRFSSRAAAIMTSTIQHHLRPLLLSLQEKVTSRAMYRLFHDSKEAGLNVVLLSMTDTRATEGRSTSETVRIDRLHNDLLEFFFHNFQRIRHAPLLTGNDLIKEFNLTPGPEFGRILENVNEAAATGDVCTREEALEWARNILRKK